MRFAWLDALDMELMCMFWEEKLGKIRHSRFPNSPTSKLRNLRTAVIKNKIDVVGILAIHVSKLPEFQRYVRVWTVVPSLAVLREALILRPAITHLE